MIAREKSHEAMDIFRTSLSSVKINTSLIMTKEWMKWSTENINISPGLYHLQIAMMQIGTVQVHICMYVICHHIGCTNKTKLKQNKTSYKLFWCSLHWRQRRSSGFCSALPVSSWYTRLAWPDRGHPYSCQGWYWLMSILYYPRPSQNTNLLIVFLFQISNLP